MSEKGENMKPSGEYKGFEYFEKSYGVELPLPKSCRVFNTLEEMQRHIEKQLLVKDMERTQ